MSFIMFFLLAAVVCFAFVPFVRRFAIRFRAVDMPMTAPYRKVHEGTIPLLGGIAVAGAFFIVVLIAYLFGIDFSESAIKTKHLLGLFVASCLLMIGGFLDDRYRLRPSQQFLWPFLAAIVVIVSGIGITAITHPFGGPLGTEQLRLDSYEKILFWFQGVPYKITIFADLFTFVWLMGMMYTTKFLDGLDGLTSGVAIIGALMIAAIAVNPVVAQKETALLAVIVAGAFAGFLFWNWHPAKIFLGEGGSLFAGFMLGTLSIISGSKVATTALVFAVPIFDVAWVIVRRLFFEHHSPFRGDRKHLHFRLLDLGLSHRNAVLLLYFLTAYSGVTALFLQSRGSLALFVTLSIIIFTSLFGLLFARFQGR